MSALTIERTALDELFTALEARGYTPVGPLVSAVALVEPPAAPQHDGADDDERDPSEPSEHGGRVVARDAVDDGVADPVRRAGDDRQRAARQRR
jgi:hypothetical protein